MNKIIILLFIVSSYIYGQWPIPRGLSTLSASDKDIGALVIGPVYATNITIKASRGACRIDSIKGTSRISSIIASPDSLVNVTDSATVSFNVNRAAAGSFIETLSIYYNGRPAARTVNISYQIPVDTDISAPTNLLAANNQSTGIALTWTDPNILDTLTSVLNDFNNDEDLLEWDAVHGDATEVTLENNKLKIYDNNLASIYPAAERTINISNTRSYRITTTVGVGTSNSAGMYIKDGAGTVYYNTNSTIDATLTAIVENPEGGTLYIKLQANTDNLEYAYHDNFKIEYTDPKADSVQLWKQLFYAGSADETYNLLTTLPATDLSYIHTGILNGAEYAYKLRFKKNSLYSDYSTPDTAQYIYIEDPTETDTVYTPTYYVSNSTGDDSNNGLTPATAWKTKAKVSAEMNNFVAGDVIAFQANNSFLGTTQLTINKSGTAGNPIVFTSYGIGNRPILSIEGNTTTYYPTIAVTASNIVIDSLRIKTKTMPDANNGSLGLQISGAISNVSVNDCEFDAANSNVHTAGKVRNGINYYASSPMENIYITNCYFHDLNRGVTGDVQEGENNQVTGYIDGCTFENIYSEIYDEAEPVRICGTLGGSFGWNHNYGFTIKNSYFTGWGENALDFSQSQNLIVEYNTFEYPKDIYFITDETPHQGTVSKGGAKYSYGTIFRFNVMKNLERPNYGSYASGITFDWADGFYMYGNLIVAPVNGVGSLSNPTIYNTTVENHVYYNTFITDQQSIGAWGSSAGHNKWNVKNNILIVTSSLPSIQGYAEFNIENNIYNNIPMAGSSTPMNSAYYAGNTTISDPATIFVNYNNNDFTLLGSAAAVDAAVLVGNSPDGFNMDLTALNGSRDNSPDLGAYEYGATNPTVTAPEIDSIKSTPYYANSSAIIKVYFTSNATATAFSNIGQDSTTLLSNMEQMNISGSIGTYTYSGLTTDVRYYFRCKVQNSAGVDTSIIDTFRIQGGSASIDTLLIANNTDDTYRRYSTIYETNTILYVGDGSTNPFDIGIRFNNMDNFASIDSAKMIITSNLNKIGNIGDTTKIRIYGEETETPDTYSDYTNWASRVSNLTTAYEEYNITEDWTADSAYSLDVTTVIQELNSSYTYTAGYINLFILDNGSNLDKNRSFYAKDNGSKSSYIIIWGNK